MNAEEIRRKAAQEIARELNLNNLEKIRIRYLGRKGSLAELINEIPELPNQQDRKEAGELLNTVKGEIELLLEKRYQSLKEKDRQKIEEADYDPTTPGRETPTGSLHPLTQFRAFVRESFEKLGFEEVLAPHIETDAYNFGLLNIPPEHPSRDLWDTFYLDETRLLRCHTSNIQVREMEKKNPPIKAMSFDRCFRYEAVDPRHTHTFTQFDLIYIDKGVSMANLKWLSDYFMKLVFGEETKIRLRPKYYPFVEPGVGIDAFCPFCKGKGCKICGKGWLELAGAGMVHPQVLKNGGIDPKTYSGLAWGFGPNRILMIKLGIDDGRYFYEGDLRFLKQF
jgi:phenylalanyl-tRNA synthetase alpha chain